MGTTWHEAKSPRIIIFGHCIYSLFDPTSIVEAFSRGGSNVIGEPEDGSYDPPQNIRRSYGDGSESVSYGPRDLKNPARYYADSSPKLRPSLLEEAHLFYYSLIR